MEIGFRSFLGDRDFDGHLHPEQPLGHPAGPRFELISAARHRWLSRLRAVRSLVRQ
jgi:hypothetical protein